MISTALDSRALAGRVGETFTSDYAVTVTIEQVRHFAELTGADHWMHTDPERARHTPLGRATVQGLLTLALGAEMQTHVLDVRAADAVFYGIDRVRFPAPMFVGDRLGLEIDIVSVDQLDGGVQARFRHRFVSSAATPVCVCEQVIRYTHDREGAACASS